MHEPLRAVATTAQDEEYDDSDLSDAQWLYGISRLLAEDWAVTPEEDIYTLADGEPFEERLDSTGP